VKEIAKKLFIGTRFEPPLRRLHHALTGDRGSLYDLQTVRVMRRVLRPDSNGIDVGCFEGGMLKHLLRLAPRGRHVAFEPIPERFERLRRAFAGAPVDVNPFALADRPGEATFVHVLRYPAMSGLRRRVDLAPDEATSELRVPVETLDRVLPPGFDVALVKIDVEGGELGVFRGGIETLRRTRPVVVFESGLGGAGSYGVAPEEIYDTVVRAIGLKISLMGDWLAGGAPLSSAAFAEEFHTGRNFYFLAHP
jgi:FkbM family methyltransferase